MDFELVRFLCDVFLQDLRFGSLGVAKIHHFIHQFIHNYKIITNGLFFELFEILGEDLDDLVEEEEDFGSICIALGKGKEVEVVVSYVEILKSCHCQHFFRNDSRPAGKGHTLIPSSEKHGGTAELSSSASLRSFK